MPQADTEDGLFAQQVADRRDGRTHRRRVARPVAQKHTIRVPLQDLLGARRRGHDRHRAALRPQEPQDVVLDAIIERHDPVLHRRLVGLARQHVHDRLVPVVRRLHRHVADDVPPHQAGVPVQLGPQRVQVGRHRGDNPAHGPLLADVPHEPPRVDALQTDDAVGPQVLIERPAASPVARMRAVLLDHEPAYKRPAALHVLVVRAVVADQRIGHRHDLLVVRRIGEDLLVAGHGRVEHDLAHAGARRPKGPALEAGPVFQQQNRLGSHRVSHSIPECT